MAGVLAPLLFFKLLCWFDCSCMSNCYGSRVLSGSWDNSSFFLFFSHHFFFFSPRLFRDSLAIPEGGKKRCIKVFQNKLQRGQVSNLMQLEVSIALTSYYFIEMAEKKPIETARESFSNVFVPAAVTVARGPKWPPHKREIQAKQIRVVNNHKEAGSQGFR